MWPRCSELILLSALSQNGGKRQQIVVLRWESRLGWSPVPQGQQDRLEGSWHVAEWSLLLPAPSDGLHKSPSSTAAHRCEHIPNVLSHPGGCGSPQIAAPSALLYFCTLQSQAPSPHCELEGAASAPQRETKSLVMVMILLCKVLILWEGGRNLSWAAFSKRGRGIRHRPRFFFSF